MRDLKARFIRRAFLRSTTDYILKRHSSTNIAEVWRYESKENSDRHNCRIRPFEVFQRDFVIWSLRKSQLRQMRGLALPKCKVIWVTLRQRKKSLPRHSGRKTDPPTFTCSGPQKARRSRYDCSKDRRHACGAPFWYYCVKALQNDLRIRLPI